MPEGYGYEGSGSRKMGKKKMKYGENYSHGGGKLKGKAMEKGGMKYEKAKGSQDTDANGKKTPMKHEKNMPAYKSSGKKKMDYKKGKKMDYKKGY